MKARRHGLWAGGFALAVLALLAPVASAQLDTGSIVGTVTDAQGAVLPGVTVTVVQAGTSFTYTAVTNAKGQYTFPNLRIGSYNVSVEMQGFKKGVRQGVQLHVQGRPEVSFALELGAISEEVVVSGQAELLQTQTGDMGHAVDQRQLTDLPLLGRRYAELALLQTGVVQSGVGVASRGEDTFFNANGNFATWNNYTLDGGDNNSFSTNLQERSPQVIQPPVDALEEFKIQTRTYSAEFGRSAGAVINASIKQGTNQFKGVVFGFLRDEAFNSNTWENENAGREKGKYNQYIGGATLGGPIVKDKLFIFGDYQGTKSDQALTQLATVPTALMRQGNLIELNRSLTGSSPFVPSGCVNTVTKQISPACFDPVAARLINLYPLPNIQSELAKAGQPNSFGLPNYINNGVLKTRVNSYDVRLDARPGNKTSLFARYSYQNTKREEPPVLGNVASGDFNSDIDITGMSTVLGWTQTLSDSMITEVRASWNRIEGDTFHWAFGDTSNADFGIQGIPQDPRYSGGIPNTNIGGLTRLGGPFFRPQFQTSQIYQLSANLAWHRGSHSFKFGVERRRDKVDYLDLRALNGFLSFSDARYTGSGIGDFLLGLATQQGLTLYHEANLYADGYQVFAQDSWRPSSKLTLNYGIRYEYFTPMFDENDIMTNIDPASGQTFTAQDGGTFERTLIHPDKNNFAPRVAFSYSASDKMVLRGGYGIYYQHTDRYGSESQLALNPPQLIDVFVTAPSAAAPPVLILKDGFVPPTLDNINPAAVQWRIQDPNQKTPIIHQFSFGPEYQLMDNTVMSVEYVGNLIRNGRRLRNLNQGQIQANGSVVFPYAQYGYGSAFLEQIVTNGRANYHALQTKLQRRMSSGLGFTASYTFSKALGDFLDHLAAGGGATGNTPQNAWDMANDYGPMEFDVNHRFVLSFVYELPAGKGRKTQLSGVAGALLNDWSLNGILSLNSGRPFTITASDRSGTGAGHISRANCLGDAQPSGFDKTVSKWFDTTQFSQPTSGFGDCGANTVRAPGSKNLNLSLFRSFPLPKDRRIEFRIEAFNVFNWVNYAIPGQSVANPTSFGVITSSLGDPRQMQFAVKFYY
ncbi:MAG: TonB-dependent receptor [Vicinamibacteria bacterium]